MKRIYCDMDGVVADFETGYMKIVGNLEWNRPAFHNAILNHKLFLTLPVLPGAGALLDAMRQLAEEGHQVQMLTSVGTQDSFVGRHVAAQKAQWLARVWRETTGSFAHLPYMNLSHNKSSKGNWADADSLLIDDHEDCIKAFRNNGGHGYLYDHKVWEEAKDFITPLKPLYTFAHG